METRRSTVSSKPNDSYSGDLYTEAQNTGMSVFTTTVETYVQGFKLFLSWPDRPDKFVQFLPSTQH